MRRYPVPVSAPVKQSGSVAKRGVGLREWRSRVDPEAGTAVEEGSAADIVVLFPVIVIVVLALLGLLVAGALFFSRTA